MHKRYNIAIASDHAGYQQKDALLRYLLDQQHNVFDLGTNSEKSVDYPDFAYAVCDRILAKAVEFGILICGTGIGMSIAANRFHSIRAGLCHNIALAEYSRMHNDANVLVLGARMTSVDEMKHILDKFLSTKFEGGRHVKRLNKVK